MRTSCGTCQGADPSSILSVYKKQILNKWDEVQYEAHRIVTEAMRSTPINTLLAECGDTSPEVRRKVMTNKLTFKLLAYRDHIVRELIISPSLNCRLRNLWRNKQNKLPLKSMGKIGGLVSDNFSFSQREPQNLFIQNMKHKLFYSIN